MAPCALTLYWPEGAAAPQDAAAPLLGWGWVSRCSERCTVVAGVPGTPGCSGAQVRCVGEWLPSGSASAKRRPTASAEAFVSVSALCAGVPSALELWLRGERVLEVNLVVVLYKARTPTRLRGRSARRNSRALRCAAAATRTLCAAWQRCGGRGARPRPRTMLHQRVRCARVWRSSACCPEPAAAAAAFRRCAAHVARGGARHVQCTC